MKKIFSSLITAVLSLILAVSSGIAGSAKHEPAKPQKAGKQVVAASVRVFEPVADAVIREQREALADATADTGIGPQSPRNIDSISGENFRTFAAAPPSSEMNLCNIHFHENAEHRGGEFTTYAGNGDGHGYGTGFRYDGELTHYELTPPGEDIGVTEHGNLVPGDTIEVHYVYTTAEVTPGPTLAACLSDEDKNPQLRVEAQVYVLVTDESALDFRELTRLDVVNGLHQATNVPDFTGVPVEYAGSTTGPGYNEQGSPYQVTWSVRPQVAKVYILSMSDWLEFNPFNEDHAHGVRNLVINPTLLSVIRE